MHILNGTANWRDAIPVPSDGDLADEASITQAIQQVANNLRWLYELTTGKGVLAVRRVVDLPALKALRDMADGQVTYVASRGLYLYIDPNATPESLPWAVAPGVGTGMWLHPLTALRNVPNGVTTTDGAGRIPRDAMPLSLAQPPIYVEPTSYGQNANAAWTNVPTAEARANGVRAGDILEVDAIVVASALIANAEILFVRLLIGAAETRPSKVQFRSDVPVGAVAGSALTLPLAASYTCSAADEAAGGVTARIQMSASGALPCSVTPSYIRIRHLRP